MSTPIRRASAQDRHAAGPRLGGTRTFDIDYINLHGTATKSNDASEDKAVFEVFGGRTPCSSTKGATGHPARAAGITEAIVCILADRARPSAGQRDNDERRPALKSNYLLENKHAKVTRALDQLVRVGGKQLQPSPGVAG